MGNRFLFGVLIVLLLLVFGQVAWGQESTPDTPGEVVNEPPPDGDGQEVGFLRQVLISIGTYLAGIGTALLMLPRLLSSVRNDKTMLALIEGLANSIPADRRLQLGTVGDGLIDAGAILKEVTDNTPVMTKELKE